MDNFRKPSEKEDEYFARKEYERKKKVAEEAQRKLQEDEKRRLRELHWLRCPKCGMEMIEVTFHGVTLDKCSGCGGYFTDPGEIDQVIRSGEAPIWKRIFGVTE